MAVRPNKPEWRRNYFKTEPPPKPGKLPPRAVTPPVKKPDSVKKAKRLVLEKPFAALCKDAGVKASVAQARRYLGGTGTAFAYSLVQALTHRHACQASYNEALAAGRDAHNVVAALRASAEGDPQALDAAAGAAEAADKVVDAALALLDKAHAAVALLEARRVVRKPPLRAA